MKKYNTWDGLFESTNNLEDVLYKIVGAYYEVQDNEERGLYTGCHTVKELSTYLKGLAKKLDNLCDDFKNVYDEDEDDSIYANDDDNF
jgi:hypothetical protein